ncbi:MAG: uroporphyrinogen decarboxylase, partial [Anaerolineae bacterium]
MFAISENWSELTPKERQEARLNSWVSAQIEFASPEAEQGYRQRTQMIKDVIQLKKPERVPIIPWWGVYPAEYAGITVEEAMYDYEKLGMAWKKFNADFMPDGLVSAALVGPGKVLDMLDYKVYHWPGHGTPSNTSYQCIEDEYMTADEYDVLIADPTNYFLRFYLPRVFGALGPWQMIGALTDITE